MTARDHLKTVVLAGKRYPLANVTGRSQLGIFQRKFTVGDASADSDDYQSSLILSNFSGGIGIEDSDEGADTSRFWFGVIDSRSSRMLALPPLVTATKPAGASGAARPLGVIGTQFYCCFDTNAYAFKADNSGWHTTANALSYAPANKSVRFDGALWVPLGGNGCAHFTESNASTGALTGTRDASPKAAALAIWNNNLYALGTDGTLWVVAPGSTTWNQIANSGGTNLVLHAGETPKNLVSYFNRAGEPTLWAITDRAAYMYYETAVEWRMSNIQFPPHPDFGRAACVWRPGEDLWIAAATDVVRQTTGNAVVPLSSGLARDQGLPQQYRGTIVDLEPETSTLFALVGGTPETSATSLGYSAQFGTSGSGDGQFADARGIAVDSGGNVWVADDANCRVQKFTSGGAYSAKFGAAGTGNGQFGSGDGPWDVAVDSADNLYVTDRGNSRIQVFSSAGSFVRKWGLFGSTNGAFNNPIAIDVHRASGRVYVVDVGNARVQYFSSTGTFQGKWGTPGAGDGQFSAPTGIAVNQSTGDVYVCEETNRRIQQFTSAGVFVRKWGSPGLGNGQFGSPRELAINPVTGNVFVTDLSRRDVQEFTPTGVFVRTIGKLGAGNGEFRDPQGIAFAQDGTALYVSDADLERVQQFTESTVTTAGVTSFSSLHGWTGTGWHGLWTNDTTDANPTWAAVSAPSSHYRLWWGSEDGNAYWLPLRRGFHNPLQGFQAGIDTFAASGFLITSKFDAGMAGFTKIASHVVAQAIAATASETITIEYAVDEGGWETLGVIDSPDESRFSFGAAGRAFNTIQFRLSLARGATTTLTPLLRSLTMLFVKVPQEARSFVFTILPGGGDQGQFGRDGQAMFRELDDLVASNAFFPVTYNGQTFDHCRIASVTGHDNTVDAGGQRVVTVVELPTGTAA